MLSWVRLQGERFALVWCQVSQDGWDAYAGSKFVVEFQVSDEPVVGATAVQRRQLGKMVDDRGREEMRAIQNAVIASLRPPPENHPFLHLSQQVRDYYMAKFRQVDQPYSDRHDIWCRYAQPDHIHAWADFIMRKLPSRST